MATREWDIPHGAVRRHVTVERAENGKDVIRVDGRVASRPLGAEEQEREFLIRGATYLLRRVSADGFDIELIAPATEKSPYVVTKAAESQLGDGRLRGMLESIRLGRLVWLAVAVVLGVMLFWAVGPNYEKQAVARVELLLSEMAKGTGSEEALAVGIWARNARTLDTMELSWAAGAFPRFRKAKHLDRKFSEWKVLDSELVENASVPTAIVSVEVEGRSLKMLVPERRTIEWTE